MLVEIYVSPLVEMSVNRRATDQEVAVGVAQLQSRLDQAFSNRLRTLLGNRLPVPVVSWHVHDEGSEIVVLDRQNPSRRWKLRYVAPKVVATVDIPSREVAVTWLTRFRDWAGDVKAEMNSRLPAGVRVDQIRWREKGATGIEGTD